MQDHVICFQSFQDTTSLHSLLVGKWAMAMGQFPGLLEWLILHSAALEEFLRHWKFIRPGKMPLLGAASAALFQLGGDAGDVLRRNLSFRLI
jgi:hypothetical protein